MSGGPRVPLQRPPLSAEAILYRWNAANHCPDCGRAQWDVGRVTAECAFCGTILTIASGAPLSLGKDQ